MGLGSLIAGMAGAAASAIGSAIKNNNKNNKKPSGSSSSGSSSSGSSGSSSSSSSSSSGSLGQQMTGGGKYNYGNTYNDAGEKTITSKDAAMWEAGAQQAARDWHTAKTDEERQRLHEQAKYYNGLLGKSYDDKTGTWKGGYAIQDENPYADAYAQYREQMQQAADHQQAAIQAGVDSAVAGLNAQKGQVGKLTEKSNAAAEKAYMQTLNPNGSLAENLAANGLLSTGLTESSQIQAGNAYQGALNDNATTETEAIAEIERAITQAKLNGDLQGAQVLANLLTQIAEKGYQNAQNIAQWEQWDTQNKYQQGVTDAGLTGVYNGKPTLAAQELEMQRKRLEEDMASGKLDRLIGQKELERLEEEIRAMKLQNKYYESQV